MGGRLYKENNQKKLYNHTYFVFLCMSDLEHFSGDVGSIYFFGCFIIDDILFILQEQLREVHNRKGHRRHEGNHKHLLIRKKNMFMKFSMNGFVRVTKML